MKKNLIAIATIGVILLMNISVFGVVADIDGSEDSLVSMILNPTDDTFIKIGGPDNNYGSRSYLQVRNMYGSGGSDIWAWDSLIKFEISIPPGAIIESAKLHLYYYKTWDANPAGRELNLYRATRNWNENDVTWNTQPAYANESSANSTVPSSVGKWMTFDVISDIIDFADGSTDNYGWKITDENYWGRCDIPIICFYSKEYNSVFPISESTKHMPYLEIEYMPDVTPPATTYKMDGQIGDNGWYVSKMKIALTAKDDMSGVDKTYYSIDRSFPQLYEHPFAIETDGNTIISYYSVDLAGNIEQVKQITVKIDTSAPTTKAILPPSRNLCYPIPVTVALKANDEPSGVKSTFYRVDKVDNPKAVDADKTWCIYKEPFIVSGGGVHVVEFFSVDNAGNKETVKSVTFIIFIIWEKTELSLAMK